MKHLKIMDNYNEPRFNGFVGMPAALYLDEFARLLRDYFKAPVYLVGSALERKDWHDLDIRVILPDERFEFGDPAKRFWNAKWISACLAFTALGEKMIGCKIDFQIEQESYVQANCTGKRLEIGKKKHEL
jgi:hypothetical protein